MRSCTCRRTRRQTPQGRLSQHTSGRVRLGRPRLAAARPAGDPIALVPASTRHGVVCTRAVRRYGSLRFAPLTHVANTPLLAPRRSKAGATERPLLCARRSQCRHPPAWGGLSLRRPTVWLLTFRTPPSRRSRRDTQSYWRHSRCRSKAGAAEGPLLCPRRSCQVGCPLTMARTIRSATSSPQGTSVTGHGLHCCLARS